jgi:ATP-dependent Clp protease adaptor protein ClpS
MQTFYEENADVLVADDVEIGEPSFLIVHNDEVNTFDWVIQTFMDVLRYADDQAEQLATIIHFKGKATVKTAPFSVLRPMKDALCERGLSAEIEGKKEPTGRS